MLKWLESQALPLHRFLKKENEMFVKVTLSILFCIWINWTSPEGNFSTSQGLQSHKYFCLFHAILSISQSLLKMKQKICPLGDFRDFIYSISFISTSGYEQFSYSKWKLDISTGIRNGDQRGGMTVVWEACWGIPQWQADVSTPDFASIFPFAPHL